MNYETLYGIRKLSLCRAREPITTPNKPANHTQLATFTIQASLTLKERKVLTSIRPTSPPPPPHYTRVQVSNYVKSQKLNDFYSMSKLRPSLTPMRQHLHDNCSIKNLISVLTDNIFPCQKPMENPTLCVPRLEYISQLYHKIDCRDENTRT